MNKKPTNKKRKPTNKKRKPTNKKRQSTGLAQLFKQMKEQYAVLPIGGKTRVATWGEDIDFPGYQTIVRFQSFDDFRKLQDKYRIRYRTKDEEGKDKTVEVGRGTW